MSECVDTEPAFHLLFLCTGNACRSQMAEGWARHLLAVNGLDKGERPITVHSAGIEAHGVNPLAVKTMAAANIDISAQTSKTLTADLIEKIDLVVSLCGHANENCPVFPKKTEHIHWPLSDPAKASGSAAAIEAVFRASSLEIKSRILGLIENLQVQLRKKQMSY